VKAVTLGALFSEFNRESGTLKHPDSGSTNGDFLGQIGKRIILPSTHVGGPRYMYDTFQDAMAIVREYGSPDIFLTTTCSPNWEEILEKLPGGYQNTQDRPDIVARAWHLKLKAELKDLDEGILGRIKARIYVVAWSSRNAVYHTPIYYSWWMKQTNPSCVAVLTSDHPLRCPIRTSTRFVLTRLCGVCSMGHVVPQTLIPPV
jgi:hypothetical protein